MHSPRVLDAHGVVPESALEAIAAVVARQATLHDVVQWALSCRPPRLVHHVLVQDEYTHDVVVPWADGLYLVYDTT
jgi:hypothetical protein